MKISCPGMVGGLGPASTVTYYQKIIEGFRERTGDGSYPYMVINSVDMSSVLDCMERKDYDTLLRLLSTAVEKLKRAGAGFAFIASNTPHIVFPALKSASPIPLVSIVDATVRNACRAKYKKVLLTGTLFTMENTFYSDAFDAKGIRCVVPEKHERLVIQNIIFPNLEDGIVDPVQKKTFIDICEQIIAKEKTDAVILGCTELPMLVKPGELSVPSIDTLEAHVELILDTLFS